MRRIPALAAVALTSLAACVGERAAERLEVGVGEGDAMVDSTYPAFAARQLGRLRAGTTLEQWLAASPRDTVVLARAAGARADTVAPAGFCARATLVRPLAGGGRAVRHAYFYPPAPDPAAPLPAPGGSIRLLRAACAVGVVTTHFEAPSPEAAEAAAATLRDSLAPGEATVGRPMPTAVLAYGRLPEYVPGAAAPAAASATGAATDVPELRALAPGLACASDAGRFHDAVQAAEGLARATTDRSLAARLHLALADTYTDLVALSYAPEGAADDYALPEPSGLRARAAEHYRAALAKDPGLSEARRAWSAAWRLLAGLAPERRTGC